MVLTVELERYIPLTNIFYIISKFRHRYNFYLVVLFVINKSSKVSFYYSIGVLSPAISLRLKRSKKLLFDTQKVEKRESELRYIY